MASGNAPADRSGLVCLAVSVGKSIRLYLADGTPGGLLTAEIMNWTGHLVAAPRSALAGLLKRLEASRTGVYLLLDDDPESLGGSLAYIGEGDDVGKRMYQHARAEDHGGKDFWDRAVILTSKDANLTKAHARYLESRFITLAMQARRSRLVNGTAPAPLPLPEADISDMEYFIAEAQIMLPVLGVNILRSAAAAADGAAPGTPAPAQSSSPLFTLLLKKGGIAAGPGKLTAFPRCSKAQVRGPPGPVPSMRTRHCTKGLCTTASWCRSPAARRRGLPATRYWPARVPRRPSSRDGRPTGVLTGSSTAPASASATGKTAALIRRPNRYHREPLASGRDHPEQGRRQTSHTQLRTFTSSAPMYRCTVG